MQIFVINLDRSPMRWQRMAGLLQGLTFERIAAVDGKTIAGPETRDHSQPRTYETLPRYNRACALSHRAVWQEFLTGTGRYCCVLEDDVFISGNFQHFVNDEAWIPAGGDLIKIETTQQEIYVSTKMIPCLDRVATRLDSVHLGTAAYIVSRHGAQVLLDLTAVPDTTVDRLLFGPAGLEKLSPIYQLIPALCIQASHYEGGMIFQEMESTIQPKITPPVQVAARQRTLPEKIGRELVRPFFQLKQKAGTAILRLRGLRKCRVPFT